MKSQNNFKENTQAPFNDTHCCT